MRRCRVWPRNSKTELRRKIWFLEKNRVETSEIINEKLNREVAQLKEENEKIKKEKDEIEKKHESQFQTICKITNNEFKNFGFIGFGHFTAQKDRRSHFPEAVVRLVLRAIDAGLTEINFLEWDRFVFYFLFFVSTRYRSRKKFFWGTNLEVTEGGWYLRHQTFSSNWGGDGFWKLWLKKNGKNLQIRDFYF